MDEGPGLLDGDGRRWLDFSKSDHSSGKTVVLFSLGSVDITCTAFLVAGYGFAAIMLLVYFVVENGPIHRSRTVENSYLAVVLALIQIFSKIVSGHRLAQEEINEKAVESIQSIMRLILFAHIVRTNASFQQHPPYYDSHASCVGSVDEGHRLEDKSTTWSHRQPTNRMRRIVNELETAFSEVLEMTVTDQVFRVIDSCLVPILYFLFMLSDFASISLSFAKSMGESLFYCDMVVYFYVLWLLVRKQVKRRKQGKHIHAWIEAMVAGQEKDNLEYVLTHSSMSNLVDVALWTTVRLLTRRAVDENLLSTLCKTVLVDALQKKGLQSMLVLQEVQHIILSCKGEDLTAFKNAIDDGGDYHNLYKLIYTDIVDSKIRNEIVEHLIAEAKTTRDRRGDSVGVKILSDVDDTLYCSGGRFPAGCDSRFPKHVVYPGCLSLFRLLDRGFRADAHTCNLIFLSARPHVFKDYAEDHSYRLFKELVSEGRMHCMPTLLPGELRQGIQAIVNYPFRGTKAWKSVGALKMATYHRFQRLYQEYDFIFFGDNGQGDLWAGEQMTRASEFCAMAQRTRAAEPRGGGWPKQPFVQHMSSSLKQGPRLLGVCIHEVMPPDKCLSSQTPDDRGHGWRQGLKAKNVFLHNSYVGAALLLHEYCPDVLSLDQVAKVASDAIKEFDDMRLIYPDWNEKWEDAERSLRSDVELVNAALHEANKGKLKSLSSTTNLLESTGVASRAYGGLAPSDQAPDEVAVQMQVMSIGSSSSWVEHG